MEPEDLDLIRRSLDADLSAPERHRLEALLGGSAAARRAHAEERQLRDFVAGAAAESFGPYFGDRVMARLAAAPAAPGLAKRLAALFLRPAWGAALAAAVLLVAVALWGRPDAGTVTATADRGATRTVTLADGSTVQLAAASTIRYARDLGADGERRLVLEGEAFFDVVQDAGRPFVVETFNAVVAVRGTSFNVRAWPDDPTRETEVAVATGQVAVSAKPDAAEPAAPAPEAVDAAQSRIMTASGPVLLGPGEGTRVAAGAGTAGPAQRIALDRALAWRSGGLAFADRPLGTVFNTLERRYNIRITASEAVRALRVTYLDPEPGAAADVLSDICHTLGLRYRATAGGFEVLAL